MINTFFSGKPKYCRQRVMHCIGVISVIIGVVFVDVGKAQSAEDQLLNVVYRESSGQWSSESQGIAEILLDKAHRSGSVTLWVTLNYPFQTTFDEMTNGEITAQQQAVRRELKNLLGPLERSGVISFPSGRMKVTANGCRVSATAAGLQSLLSDQRVLHMVEVS